MSNNDAGIFWFTNVEPLPPAIRIDDPRLKAELQAKPVVTKAKTTKANAEEQSDNDVLEYDPVTKTFRVMKRDNGISNYAEENSELPEDGRLSWENGKWVWV